jgi:hypothetical protein
MSSARAYLVTQIYPLIRLFSASAVPNDGLPARIEHALNVAVLGSHEPMRVNYSCHGTLSGLGKFIT